VEENGYKNYWDLLRRKFEIMAFVRNKESPGFYGLFIG